MNAIALGSEATASGDDSVAIGTGATVQRLRTAKQSPSVLETSLRVMVLLRSAIQTLRPAEEQLRWVQIIPLLASVRSLSVLTAWLRVNRPSH